MDCSTGAGPRTSLRLKIVSVALDGGQRTEMVVVDEGEVVPHERGDESDQGLRLERVGDPLEFGPTRISIARREE